jgi:hypothetical protein
MPTFFFAIAVTLGTMAIVLIRLSRVSRNTIGTAQNALSAPVNSASKRAVSTL